MHPLSSVIENLFLSLKWITSFLMVDKSNDFSYAMEVEILWAWGALLLIRNLFVKTSLKPYNG